MWKITQRKFVYLGQKLGRNTHLDRKDVSVLPNEKECSEEVV